MFENTILKANRQGRRALTLLMTFPSLRILELAAREGFDAVHLDAEHGDWSPPAVDDHVLVAHAYGLSVTARVPSILSEAGAFMINLFLDRGIQGILAPHVETGQQAKAVVDACLFPPAGKRSWGDGRGTEFNDDETLQKRYGGKTAFMAWSNENMIISAQIESKLGWDNLDHILSVPGLTAIAGGPNDLASSLGFAGEPDHPSRVAATADIEARARQAGLLLGGNANVVGGHETVVRAADLLQSGMRDAVRQKKSSRL